MNIHVKVAVFEGPLDLLLHLIEEARVDIYEIPLAEIASQYMEALEMMKELEIEVATEFLVMAAELLAIKSRRLLPSTPTAAPSENQLDSEEDLQQILIQRLIQYRQYKAAAEALKQREMKRNLLYTRPPLPALQEKERENVSSHPQKLAHSIHDLLAVYLQVLQRETEVPPRPPAFLRKRMVSLEEKLQQIVNWLHQVEKLTFWQLISVRQRQELVVTFLALLELMKMKQIIMQQKALFAEITIVRRVSHAEDKEGIALTQV